MKNEIKIDGLYKAGFDAYRGISFDPEKRALQVVVDYEQEINNDVENMPEEEKERFIENYKKHLFAWLYAKSRVLSTMITGPANFNVRRNEKANNSEHKRREEFREWRQNAFNAINKRIEAAKPEEQKRDERWERLKKELLQKIEWRSVANFYSMVERLAYNGEIELVKESVGLVQEYNDTHKTPFITTRHKLWGLPEIAERVKANKEAKAEKESEETTVNGVKVVKNFGADRIQLFFDGKPQFSTIQNLKKHAFKWSPSNMCWQRQLTQNAIYAANYYILNNV